MTKEYKLHESITVDMVSEACIVALKVEGGKQCAISLELLINLVGLEQILFSSAIWITGNHIKTAIISMKWYMPALVALSHWIGEPQTGDN